MEILEGRRTLIILGMVGAIILTGCVSQDLSQQEFTALRLGDGSDWVFVNAEWQENAEGILTPADQPVEENLAFYTARAYSDFEAGFEFRWDHIHTGTGFVFRAEDAQHYYLVHFPCTGQQYRAEHFWAAISKVDETGWVKVLKMAMVQGVPSEVGLFNFATRGAGGILPPLCQLGGTHVICQSL